MEKEKETEEEILIYNIIRNMPVHFIMKINWMKGFHRILR